MAVLGINTARSLTWKNGRVSREQMKLIRDTFCATPAGAWKVLITHHPFLAPPDGNGSIVGRAEEMFLKTEGCGPDVALAGHFHMSYAGGTHAVHTGAMGSTLVIQAGTAISRRTRDERNAFNLITLETGGVRLSVRMWNGKQFEEKKVKHFNRKDGTWVEGQSTPERRL
jgi:3',5'-cyclic AMP phosphodiesterase CpdA